jgi:N-acyl homoserine lactone hydrolase
MLRVYALCGGYLDLDSALFFADRATGTRWTVPIPAFLVEHAAGRLLFDTGVHCAAITDPVGRLGERQAQRFGVRSRPGDDVVSQLALLGIRPDDVAQVANSHFHFDHCGGNEFFPRSTFLVQREEWEAARDPAVLAQQRYVPSAQDFDQMARSLARLRDLRDRQGATVIFGHDPAQWRALRRAPEPLAVG